MKTITNGPLTMVCDDPLEVWRAETAFTKEPGTIAWLNTLKPGEVFYDIGANVGVYTLLAAHTVGVKGHVYAFEPHLTNAEHLRRNVTTSDLDARVTLLTMPIDETSGPKQFWSRSARPGSSGHQCGHHHDETGKPFTPFACETLKFSASLDDLLREQAIQPAHLVKIDVDGNEWKILRGMKGLLGGSVLRSVQVELHPNHREQIVPFMLRHGWQIDHTHYTEQGQIQIESGKPKDEVVCNAVFTPVTF